VCFPPLQSTRTEALSDDFEVAYISNLWIVPDDNFEIEWEGCPAAALANTTLLPRDAYGVFSKRG
jgi:hypothetical protein